MSQVIVFETEAGNVAVCIPTGELPIQDVLKKDCPAGAFIIDQAALPNQDNDFFDAWVLNGKSVEVSIDKAKAIQKQRLRAERAPLLAAQDVAFQRALEEGKPTDAIVAEKQRLRDVTNLTDACTLTAELRALKAAK
jgi:hypothetical protein